MGTEGTDRTEGPERPEQRKEQPEQPQQEEVVWVARPSQIINFGTYLVCLVVLGFLIAAFFLVPNPQPFLLIGFSVISAVVFLVVLVRWLKTRARIYEVTSERIKIREGVFSRTTEEIELYRVRDYKLLQPFWLRLFGLGNIVVSTTDNANPTVVIEAIRDPSGHREEIRKHVERCRDRKRVRITEFES
jgi:membrane protein YdbS with pleckstrin-like domain